ncbi:MAG TPA: 16S rRNA (guanine(966)-N(2))-methyltransferase RsmD [Blastocatellia bacterium]|nr:16S rRNA (guanine(966)-N(2))-methyltransferase RsmD [Blastocatellia bacterium]
MRVIAGAYRGRSLRTVAGAEVRPTSDRLRETLFNILAPRIRGTRFLDVFAGSGAIGIEALSRGASEVTFIENAPRARSAIKANLQTLGIAERVRLISRDATPALKQLADASEQFDIVFFDPPYASELYEDFMGRLPASGLITPDSIVIVEHRAKHLLAPAYSNLKLTRQVKQGESALSFYELEDTA